ncbi:hypothetical protein [Chryseobacterium sp. NFX27]|jgi:hypothetical protein|uniref:hypothetical protein n=1 Tax=Chryseobacterium sp. NFX27 TaxID=2819618 RepID=UPI003CF5F787
MIQFILMLFGLAFSNNNANTAPCTNNQTNNPVTMHTSSDGDGVNPGDTGGETGTTLPPKK